MMNSGDDVKIYFVTIPAHKFMHIKNYESKNISVSCKPSAGNSKKVSQVATREKRNNGQNICMVSTAVDEFHQYILPWEI